MNKIINHPDDMISEMLQGYLVTCGDMLEALPGANGILMKEHKSKVSIVTGGGSGNEPWILGYVGRGLADGAALGHVYTAPPSRVILNVTKAVSSGEGVIYICTNHAGDVLNFELVGELAELEGIKTRCVFIADDITSAPKEKQSERRGVAGIALAIKVAGAACEAGLSLDEVERIAQKVNKNLYTFSVTTSPGYMPATGRAMGELPEGQIEYGRGFNGEPGVLRTALKPADEIAATMMDYLLKDIEPDPADEFAVLVNGFGFTSLLELCIVNRAIKNILDDQGIQVHDIFIDNLFCPQGTGGFSISMLKLDKELQRYYNAPAYSPFFRKSAIGEG